MRKAPYIAVIVICLIIGGIFAYRALELSKLNTTYAQYIDYSGKRAFTEFMESINSIDTALKKIKYADTGSSFATLSAEIWRQSEGAKTALSSLPVDHTQLEKYEKFISQVGDFSFSLLKDNANGIELTPERRAELSSLSNAAAQLSVNLSTLKEQIDAGVAHIGGLSLSDEVSPYVIDDSLKEAEVTFPEYSSLIYDGPFSDHISAQTPKITEGLEDITQGQGLEKAAEIAGVAKDELEYAFHAEGKIPYYSYKKGDDITIAITKTGGVWLSGYNNRAIGTVKLSPEEAVEKSEAFLQSHGFEHLKVSYYNKYENIVTVNFANTIGETIIYPDLIKVGVALDNGEIVRFDATGYIMNYHERTLEEPEITQEDAQAKVPSDLTINETNMAIVPTHGKNEVLCYEFVCKDEKDNNVIVYVNTKTGQQENIFLLIENENGVLAI